MKNKFQSENDINFTRFYISLILMTLFEYKNNKKKMNFYNLIM